MKEYYIPVETLKAEQDNCYLKQVTLYKKIYIETDKQIKPFEGFKEITLPEPTKYHLCSFCGERRDIIHSCTYGGK